MKKNKNVGRNKLKDERGSISALTAFTIFMFIVILMGSYLTIMILRQSQYKSDLRIQKVYGEDVDRVDDIYEELEEVLTSGYWDKEKAVNKPELINGMTPIKFTMPTSSNEGTIVTTVSSDQNWYEYGTTLETKKWANAKTKDGSMWVWIPRFAYKIDSENQKIDVVFLIGKTDKYFDEEGRLCTAKRCKTATDIVNTHVGYTVHPAFTDESKIGYRNGGWDEELTGFWVSKFEAGYVGDAEDETSATDSNVKYSIIDGQSGDITLIYYGERETGETSIKYPVFQGNRPSMNYLGISDAYDLCRDIKRGTSVYGLSSLDSHLTKNSEWGAIAYLTHSKYGTNSEEVRINNVSVNGENTVYAVTGYAADTNNGGQDISRNLETLTTAGQAGSWTTLQGKLASSTTNIYGIYDLNGGLWEWTAGYIAVGEKYDSYAGSLKGDSNKYKSKYTGTSNDITTNYNEEANRIRIGEAIWETSSSSTGANAWNDDTSTFWYVSEPFSMRSGKWGNGSNSGIFTFNDDVGYCTLYTGFRAVLVAE